MQRTTVGGWWWTVPSYQRFSSGSVSSGAAARQTSDSFDKCQGDSQGSQGGTHEGGGGGRDRVSLRGCYYKSRPMLEQYWPNTKFKTCQLINTALH